MAEGNADMDTGGDIDMCENPKAFDVNVNMDDVVDMSRPAADGVEFVRRVMIEAFRFDEVCVSKTTPKQKPVSKKHPDIALVTQPPTVVKEMSLPKEWVTCQITAFMTSRRKAEIVLAAPEKWMKDKFSLPHGKQIEQWFYFTYGTDRSSYPADFKNRSFLPTKAPLSSIRREGYLPLVSVMVQLSKPLIESLLEHHLSWLEHRSSFDQRTGAWLYTLLSFFNPPFSPEACDVIRHLARECSRIKSEVDPQDGFTIRMLNIFICIVVKYFHQYDLADL